MRRFLALKLVRIARWMSPETLGQMAKAEKEIKRELAKVKEQRVKNDELLADIEKRVKEVSPADLAREKYKLVDPKLILTREDLPSVLKELAPEMGEETFLSLVHDMHQKGALALILDVLKRDQGQFSLAEARTLEEFNGGRMSINGIELVREEVERLASFYKSKHTREEKFDEFKVV
jgi:hypothetical protein